MSNNSTVDLITNFLKLVRKDPRVGTSHIALYLALYYQWAMQGARDPVLIVSYQLMPLAKIASSATYHRTLHQLHEYGYLRYEPAFNRKGSKVFLSS